MNVFDFDDTIYEGDSTAHFCLYCYKRLRDKSGLLPKAAAVYIAHLAGRKSITEVKEALFSFLPRVKNIDAVVRRFWKAHEKNIKPWYSERRSESDVVISASPEFLLAPACKKLGVALIGSRVDKYTGRFDGVNNSKEEKVRRFREVFGNAEIDEFYSDSKNDDPMAKLAGKAYQVDGNRISPWRF